MKVDKPYCIDDVLDNKHPGWLKVVDENGVDVFLCYKTKIFLLKNDLRHQKIQVLEGPHKGDLLNIPYKYHDSKTPISYLGYPLTNAESSSLILDIDKEILKIKNFGNYKIRVDKHILQRGNYVITIPLRPITKFFQSSYYDEAAGGTRFMNTWFRLIPKKGNPLSLFLHYGSYSKGCVTVIQKNDVSVWNSIYLFLMKHRFNEYCLGTLQVI